MKLKRYGVTLKRITSEDLELIRYWRNSARIRNNMIYREYITPEMQKEWFEQINNYNNFFYIIQYNNDSIGLIDNKNTDWNSGTTESGLFLFDEKYYNTHIPIAASFILIEIGFYILGGKDAFIKVLRCNKRAINYNTKLGFVPVHDDPDKDYIEFILTPENFQKKTSKLRKALITIHASNDPYLYFNLEPSDYATGFAINFEKVMLGLRKDIIISDVRTIDQRTICFNF